jgi:hypothetical protein
MEEPLVPFPIIPCLLLMLMTLYLFSSLIPLLDLLPVEYVLLDIIGSYCTLLTEELKHLDSLPPPSICDGDFVISLLSYRECLLVSSRIIFFFNELALPLS